MQLVEQIQLPQPIRSIVLSPDGRQVLIAAGRSEWINAKSPVPVAKRQQSLHCYKLNDGRLEQRKVVPVKESLTGTNSPKKSKRRYTDTKAAYLDADTVALARLVTDSNWKDRVEVQVIDLESGKSRGRMLSEQFPVLVAGIAAASAKHFFVGVHQDVICLDAATLGEVCRTGELDADGNPLREDVFGEESIAPGGFSYHNESRHLFTATGYFNAGVIYCYKFDPAKGRLRRVWRREVVENRPSRKDAELPSIRAVRANPDGRGATAVFLLEDIKFDFWGQPLSDWEAARDKVLENKNRRQRLTMPKRARLGWLGKFSSSTDEWFEILSDLGRDFELVGNADYYGESKERVQVGYCTCSKESWETPIAYLDSQRIVIATPSGLLQVMDLRGGEASVEFDLRTLIDGLGDVDQPQITCLTFAPTSRRLFIGTDSGTLVSLDVEPKDVVKGQIITEKKASPAPSAKAKVTTAKIKIPKRKPDPKPPVVTESLAYSINPASFRKCVTITPDGALAACGANVWDVARQWNVSVIPSYCDHSVLTRDGRRMFSGDERGTVSLWDVTEPRKIWSATNNWHAVRHVAISSDEKLAASAHSDYKIRLWDVDRGKRVAELEGHKAYVESIAFSPDGTRLASASWDKTLCVWDLEKQKVLFTLRGHTKEVLDVAWTPDSRFLISGSGDKSVRVWDVAKRKCHRILEGHTREVLCFAISADGKTIVSGSADKTLRVWNIERAGRCIRTIPSLNGSVIALAMAENGSALGIVQETETQQGVYVWNLETSESLGRVGQWRVGNNKLTANGKYIFQSTNDKVYLGTAESASGESVETTRVDHTFSVWDVTQRKRIATLSFTSGKVYLFEEQWGEVSEDGRLAVFRGYDHDGPWLSRWDTRAGSERKFKGKFDYASALALSADGGLVITAHQDKVCRLWRTDRDTCQATLAGHTHRIVRVAISADGRYALSASEDETVHAWDTKRAESLCIFTGHKRAVTTIALSRDGKLAASGSADGLICIWDPATGECLHVLSSPPNQGVTNIVFDPTAARIATTHWSCIRVWDVGTGKALVQYQYESFTPQAIAFPDEQEFLLSLQESVIHRWPLPER